MINFDANWIDTLYVRYERRSTDVANYGVWTAFAVTPRTHQVIVVERLDRLEAVGAVVEKVWNRLANSVVILTDATKL